MFIFPSLFEELGIALLEAEANGLPIIASKDVIPSEVKLNSNFAVISLKANIAQKLKKKGRIPYREVEFNFKNKGWEIETAAKKLEELLIKQ